MANEPKLIDIGKIEKLAKALDARMKSSVSAEESRALTAETSLSIAIDEVRDMFDGKALKYLTQAEYDALPDEEKNSAEISYFITDAEDLSHVHDNMDFLNELSEAVFEGIDASIKLLQQNKLDVNVFNNEKESIMNNINNVIDDLNEECARADAAESSLQQKAQEIENMFDGRSLKYLTQVEYDALSDEEKNSIEISYFITDAEDLSHIHNNMEFLNDLSEAYLNNSYQKIIDDNLETNEKTVYGAINELNSNINNLNNTYQTIEDDSLNTEDKTIVGSINEVNNKIQIENNRAEAAESTLENFIQEVEDMFDGKSLKYLTQAEYDALSDEEKNSIEISYFITDAEDLSHVHSNMDFLDGLSDAYLDSNYQKIMDDNLNTTEKTIHGAINELKNEIDSLDNIYQKVEDTSLNTENKTIVEAINEIDSKVQVESNRSEAAELALENSILEVESMFDGKALKYLTQAEYNELSDEEKNSVEISYFITDAEDLSHSHNNIEFLDGLSEAFLDSNYQKIIDDNLNTTEKTICGAINELDEELNNLDNVYQTIEDDNLNTENKTISGAINEIDNEIKVENNRAEAAELALENSIQEVENMFDGKALKYLTQVEYDALSDEEKNSTEISYFITDATDLSHSHSNIEFLDDLSEAYLSSNYQKTIDDNLETTEKTICGAINELKNEIADLDNVYQKTEDDNLNTEDKTIVGSINEVNNKIQIENSRSEAAELTLKNSIQEVEFMFDGKSLKYLTQAEYNELSNEEKNSTEISYFITDTEDLSHIHDNIEFLNNLSEDYLSNFIEESSINAKTVNGYSIWAGTTAELEAIETRDPNTIYFEIDNDDTGEEVIQVDIVDGYLNLTTDKYQKTNMITGTELVFPEVTKFTEIHLYFDAENDMDLILPSNCKSRVSPNIESGNSYEIIATYNTIRWLVNIIVYS